MRTSILFIKNVELFLDRLRIFQRYPGQDFEERSRQVFSGLTVILTSPVLTVFSILHLIQGDFLLGICLFLAAVFLWLSVFIVRVVQRKLLIRGNLILIGWLFLGLLANSGDTGQKGLWSLVYPIVAFFLLGRKDGLIYNTSFLLGVLVILTFRQHLGLNVPDAPGFWGRFLFVLFLISGLSYSYEVVRERFKKNMLEEEEKLKKEKVKLLEAKNTLEQRVQDRTWALQEQVDAKEQALADLAAAQSSLLEASRTAGKAEVATSVLHNVGNVLNSVNVSCTLLMDQLRKSRVCNVSKVAGLMAEPEGGLVRFLTADPRGRQIPVYLASLASALQDEQQEMFKEVDALHSRIEHIKEIVAMQQSYGRVFGVNETILPEQLMEDALKLNVGTLAWHGVTVHRQYEPAPPITVDKHTVLQILLNLINNAMNACIERGGSEKTINLRIFMSGSDRIRMQVSDNGAGILPENMTRIFQHGFTTRKKGHGVGLHSGALAARDLGGNLAVHSDGPGLGAVFTLELPCGPGLNPGCRAPGKPSGSKNIPEEI